LAKEKKIAPGYYQQNKKKLNFPKKNLLMGLQFSVT
jgi:hypothetical protein